VRMSTPGHSTSGAEGVGEEGWVTPGVAPEKKLANRPVTEGELSDDVRLEMYEHPETNTLLATSSAARRAERFPLYWHRIETGGPVAARKPSQVITAQPWRPQGAVLSHQGLGSSLSRA